MNIAVIPARGGSKRIPRKNIKPFHGKPMIAYAIEAAKTSGLFEHIIVSTDDEEIAEISRKWGAEIPFFRPENLADDFVATVPVIAHSIEACREQGWEFENVCCIYPCVPFIDKEDLVRSLESLEDGTKDYCFPVAEFPSRIQRALKLGEAGSLSPFFPEFETTRTQDLESAYYDAGQFYWGKVESWLGNPKIHSSGIGFILPAERVVDIDTIEDWDRAERMYNLIK